MYKVLTGYPCIIESGDSRKKTDCAGILYTGKPEQLVPSIISILYLTPTCNLLHFHANNKKNSRTRIGCNGFRHCLPLC